jgi:hypothetical protein
MKFSEMARPEQYSLRKLQGTLELMPSLAVVLLEIGMKNG